MTQPPATIRAGETISFVASDYSAEDYTLQFVLNNGVDAPTTADGEADETSFNVSMVAPAIPGGYLWALVYTETATGEVVYGSQGIIKVLPSLLAKTTPSFARMMVEKLRGGLLALASTDKASVSFNGQSFNRVDIATYQQQLVYWESKVKKEEEEAAADSGTSQSGFIHVKFLPFR